MHVAARGRLAVVAMLALFGTTGALQDAANVLSDVERALGAADLTSIQYSGTGFTAALRADCAGTGVVVSQVCPGPVATELYLKGKSQADLDVAASRSPLGRLGQPDDIAHVIAFLASGDGRWINGQTILANGGFV